MVVIRPLINKYNLNRIDKKYRPVSNLTLISKVFERAVLDQLYQHCMCNDFYSVFQSAYKEIPVVKLPYFELSVAWYRQWTIHK